jgi:hypothetical protein
MSGASKLAQQYVAIRNQIKEMKKRKKELGGRIKEYAEQNADPDNNGNFYLSDDNYTFGKQARQSVGIDEEKAEEYLKELGIWEQASKVERKVDEDKIEDLLEEGKLDYDDIEEISYRRVSYAVSVRERENEDGEDMPEVEVSEREEEKKPSLKKVT